ncbi:MAG: ATP-binding cassette domain-containing protein [Saprospirales bacterium]|jgi:ABC-type bacteriocin/lantibiotic exporter with double-glycine peptidase domain|nr:ATP-binding cassette domain-containing protein [Saprospirales bacterium]MBK8920789.1 ATP-binding cassette domain-containing protein [Saprospirales bacterium]
MMQNPTPLTPVRRLVRLLVKYRREIRYILLYAVVAGLINLSLPLGMQAIIGLLAGGSISASWGVLVLFVLVGALITGGLRLMQLSIMEYLQRHIFTDSAIEFAVRIPRLNLELLRGEHLPELVNRFFDTQTIQKGLPKILIDGSTAALQILFSLLLLSFYHSTFVLSSLLLLGVLGGLFWWTGPRGLQTSLKESKYKYKLAYWLEEVSRVSSTFKLAGENRFPIQRADELAVNYLEARAKHWRILIMQFSSSVVFRALVLSGFLILGSLLVMENQLNIGQFVAAEILVLFIVEAVEKLILMHETAYDVLTATEKIGQVVDLPLEREGGIRVEEFGGNQSLEVELRNLSYRYSDAAVPVLKSLTTIIKAGDRVAVTGYSGAGKSTLIQILSVLKRDFTGTLLFNGLPKQNLDLRSLREHIGDFSSQEDVFKGTILENITLGRTTIPLQQVLKVAESIGLDSFIRQSPNGLDTELLPGGKNISRSIVAKLLVARAVISEPSLLVMEEPLGNLTLRDRLRIGQLLTDRRHSWTLVTATEDPLMASLCDRVLVLREGEIVFDGTFSGVQKTEHYDRIFRENLVHNTPQSEQ